jgi:hypothetical protein
MTFGVLSITLCVTNIHNAQCRMVKDDYDVETVVAQWLITREISLHQQGTDKLIIRYN